MSTSILQKQRERFLLDRFLDSLGLQAEIIEERESPDFLVYLDGKEVGIEITEMFISHETSARLPQAQESIADRIVLLAQRLYQASSAPPANVSICFSPSADLIALDRDRTAEMLSALVSDLNLGPWQVVNWRPEEFEESQVPEAISFIRVLGVPSYEMAHWTTARAGWAVPLTLQALQARIEEKSKKLKEYQKVVPENWLIVISDGTRPSQLFYASPEFDPSVVTSPFSKTFYYDYPNRTLMELGM